MLVGVARFVGFVGFVGMECFIVIFTTFCARPRLNWWKTFEK